MSETKQVGPKTWRHKLDEANEEKKKLETSVDYWKVNYEHLSTWRDEINRQLGDDVVSLRGGGVFDGRWTEPFGTVRERIEALEKTRIHIAGEVDYWRAEAKRHIEERDACKAEIADLRLTNDQLKLAAKRDAEYWETEAAKFLQSHNRKDGDLDALQEKLGAPIDELTGAVEPYTREFSTVAARIDSMQEHISALMLDNCELRDNVRDLTAMLVKEDGAKDCPFDIMQSIIRLPRDVARQTLRTTEGMLDLRDVTAPYYQESRDAMEGRR